TPYMHIYSFAACGLPICSNDSATIVITPAPSTSTVTGGVSIYDGFGHPATVLVTGVGGLNLTPAPNYSGGCSVVPVNVVDTQPTVCTASYTFAGDGDRTGSAGSATILINKANSSTTIGNGFTVIYDGV